MPSYWYEPRTLKRPESDNEEELHRYELNKKIIADRKPYFMRYIYPVMMKEYKSFVAKTDAKCRIEFSCSVKDLEKMDEDDLTERQREFLEYYKKMMPVGDNDSTMNRICRRVEDLTNDIKSTIGQEQFDYSIMKCDAEYTKTQKGYIIKLYKDHNKKLRKMSEKRCKKVVSKESFTDYRLNMINHFRRSAEQMCCNRWQLCDIVLDICYTKEGTKQFAWDVAGDVIVDSLLAKKGGQLWYPIEDPDGDIAYGGNTFSMVHMEVDSFGDSPE